MMFLGECSGNIQSDYAKSHNYPDLQYSDNYKQYKWMEDVSWIYRAEFDNPADDNSLYFVSLGIDYKYKISVNNTVLAEDEGMYSKIELDLTPYLNDKNIIEIEVYPVPKSPLAKFEDRDQANQCVKPAVSYGWDWHPRLIPSGMWQEAYIENRGKEYISCCEPFYSLSDDLKTASVSFKSNCNPKISLYSPDDVLIYEGDGKDITVENVRLWWCNGYGEQCLYKWVAKTDCDTKEGYIGFRKVRLIMNDGQWDMPDTFPKSRSNPPITIELNGLPIFAKGTNWVNPEIFVGEITDEAYETQIKYAKEANMNMFRCWGGAIINKKFFYDCCDRYGIMVWQEFTLACNNYADTPQYMKTLEKEAISIIKDLRNTSLSCIMVRR
jgi:beta-mannosidase